MSTVVSYDEADHDAHRARQWLSGQARDPGVSGAELIALGTAMSALAADDGREPVALAAEPVGVDPGIVKPLDPALLTPRDGNAEMRWEAMAGQGYVVPERPLLRPQPHPTPAASTPTAGDCGCTATACATRRPGTPRSSSATPTCGRCPPSSIPALVECAGNGRHFFASQQDTTGRRGRRGGSVVSGWPAGGACRWPPCCGAPG